MIHQKGDRPALLRLRNELVPIKTGAFQGDKQILCSHMARIRANTVHERAVIALRNPASGSFGNVLQRTRFHGHSPYPSAASVCRACSRSSKGITISPNS